MKSIMTISVNKELKEAFLRLAKELGTNPTNLANMLMQKAINSKSIEFPRPQVLDIELESVDISDWGEDFINNTSKITKDIEKAFA